VLVDHRTYRIKPGMTQAHLEIYQKHGLAAQSRHLGAPIAYMFAESGDVNTIVHDWAYEDAADRTRRRAAMWADPEWLGYIQKLNESSYLVEQKTSLMIPTKFSRSNADDTSFSASLPGLTRQSIVLAK
jgi:NIPSNAP